MRTATLIYDGDCGLCAESAKWVRARVGARAQVVAWQEMREELPGLGLTEAEDTTAAYWADADGRTYRGHRAIAKSLVAAGHPVVGRFLLMPPGTWLGRPAYWLVARYRYKLPGATDACRVDAP
jgi:predicted DCC family thiol-disulfide oxidoreductase YuxK